MATTKTKPTGANVPDFIESFVESDQRKTDSYKLVKLMQKWSGCKPYMWGPTIIGFGNYHYVYPSGHEGDCPVIGFSPRKADISFYVYSPTKESEKLLKSLGKFRMGKSCIWVKKLEDINIPVLEKLCHESFRFVEEKYEWTKKAPVRK